MISKSAAIIRANGMGGIPVVGDPYWVAGELAQLAAAGAKGIAISAANYLDELPYLCSEVLPRLCADGLRHVGRDSAITGVVMPWKAIGAAVAVTGVPPCVGIRRVGVQLVDWAWFSSIGYAAIFWTIFDTRTVLFIAVF